MSLKINPFVYWFFLGASFCRTYSSQELYIVVHGTWAHAEPWAQPGGDFFENLQQSLGNQSAAIPFSWSGKNDHAERCRAGKKLAAMLLKLSKETCIHLVAHSHGANVCFLASQELAALSNRSIKNIYALGAPIDLLRYQPNMSVISTLYNLFSFGDPVQTVSGFFERALPCHQRISNIMVSINEKRPDHAGLHSPLIAHWLTTLPNLCQTTTEGATAQPSYYGSLALYNNKLPVYELNNQLPRLLENEKKLYAAMSAFMLSRDSYRVMKDKRTP